MGFCTFDFPLGEGWGGQVMICCAYANYVNDFWLMLIVFSFFLLPPPQSFFLSLHSVKSARDDKTLWTAEINSINCLTYFVRLIAAVTQLLYLITIYEALVQFHIQSAAFWRHILYFYSTTFNCGTFKNYFIINWIKKKHRFWIIWKK